MLQIDSHDTLNLFHSIKQEFPEIDGNLQLIGTIDQNMLRKPPYNIWFIPEYNKYAPEADLVRAIKPLLAKVNIIIFFGSWCEDSQLQTPRFLKILNMASYPEKNLKIYALDRQKKGLHGEEVNRNISHVPTFIFYKNQKELNRIVESPKESLEADMKRILENQAYIPNHNP